MIMRRLIWSEAYIVIVVLTVEPEYTLHTNESAQFQQVGDLRLLPTDGLVFSVKSCSEVKVQLKTEGKKGGTQLVEIVIGNTSSIW